MGTRFNDSAIKEDELRTSAREELIRIIDAEQVPLSAEERSRLVRDVADDVLGYGPLQRLLDDPAVTEIMVNRMDQIYVERQRQADPDRVALQLRGPPAQGDRADRLQGGPAHRRVLAAGGRAARGRFPRQRRHPAARRRRFLADHPKVQQGAADRPEPHRVRHADAGDGRAAERLRQGEAEHHRLRRHRHRQDDAAQRAFLLPARTTSGS